MGCGSSISKKGVHEALERSESELAEEKQRVLDKDCQVRDVRQLLQAAEEASSSSLERTATTDELVAELRAELRAHHDESQRDLEKQKESLIAAHREHVRTAEEDADRALIRQLDERTEEAQETARLREERAELEQQSLVQGLREVATTEARRHELQTEDTERELERLREQLSPLRRDRGEAAESLARARAELQSEQSARADATGKASSLERRLAEAHAELKRGGAGDRWKEEQADAMSKASLLERRLAEAEEELRREEQRCSDLELLLNAQIRDLQAELQTCSEEVQLRNATLARRDEELAGLNGQLSDLQGLFDEVNRQLQTECGRIEKLQETVALCAKQNKELEQLQGMLGDSHRMLSEVRDALEEERAERIRVAGMLEHEQQRTQLLLDVLKHFKEKLQGLTPQVLLSRLGSGADPKALLASVGVNAATVAAAAPPPAPLGVPGPRGPGHGPRPGNTGGPTNLMTRPSSHVVSSVPPPPGGHRRPSSAGAVSSSPPRGQSQGSGQLDFPLKMAPSSYTGPGPMGCGTPRQRGVASWAEGEGTFSSAAAAPEDGYAYGGAYDGGGGGGSCGGPHDGLMRSRGGVNRAGSHATAASAWGPGHGGHVGSTGGPKGPKGRHGTVAEPLAGPSPGSFAGSMGGFSGGLYGSASSTTAYQPSEGQPLLWSGGGGSLSGSAGSYGFSESFQTPLGGGLM